MLTDMKGTAFMSVSTFLKDSYAAGIKHTVIQYCNKLGTATLLLGLINIVKMASKLIGHYQRKLSSMYSVVLAKKTYSGVR